MVSWRTMTSLRRRPVKTRKSDGGTSGARSGDSEYDRFQRLTKKLVSVPKKEITEAEKRAKKKAG
jgi:hypothetical protein